MSKKYIPVVMLPVALIACSLVPAIVRTPEAVEPSPTMEESATESVTIPVPAPAPVDTPLATVADERTERWFLMGRPGLWQFDDAGPLVISEVNHNCRYVALADQGLLISTDGGFSWSNAYKELAALVSGVPTVSQVIAHPGQAYTLYAIVSGVLVSSPDTGNSWSTVTAPAVAIAVGGGGEVIYVLSEHEIRVSTDQGKTWVNSHPLTTTCGYRCQVVADARDSGVAYVVAGGNILTTNSAGQEWSIPSMLSTVDVRQVLADDSQSGLAYALTEGNALYRTTDGGDSWGLAADLNEYGANALLDARNGSVFLDGAAAQRSTDDYENYCGTALFTSNDQGVTWAQASHFPVFLSDRGVFECPEVLGMTAHPSQQALLYSLVRHYARLTVLKSSDRGATWEMQYPLAPAYQVSVSPDGQVVYVTAHLAYKSTDGGNTWQSITGAIENALEYYHYDIAQSSHSPAAAYLVAGSKGALANACPSVFKTEDGGVSWSSLTLPDTQYDCYYRSILVNPWIPERLYLAQPNLFSNDGGVTWKPWPTIGGNDLRAIAINPDAREHIMLGIADGYPGSGLYWTPDGGQTVVPRGLGADFSIYSLAFDPGDSLVIYAVAEVNGLLGVYRSEDEGATWMPISELEEHIQSMGTPTVRASYGDLFVDPRDSATLYFARGAVFRSVDGGASWHRFSDGMGPRESVTSMSLSSTDPPILYAAGKSGVWKLVLP